jgi:polysaccharide biosynthesis protein PslG
MFRRVKRVGRHYRRSLKSREARVGIGLGLGVCLIVILSFILLRAVVIEVDNKLVITTPKEQKQLDTPIVPVNSSAKPFGVALGGTLDTLSESQLNSELSSLDGLGVRWIRIDVAWPAVQPNSSTQYDWSTYDRVMAAAAAHHLKVLGTLAYTPSWAAASGCNDSTQKCAPASDSQFANFAASVVARYGKNGVSAWEIWNEPNNEGFWMPAPNPQAYTQLLMASYTAIKKVNPMAMVISGGLGPLDSLPGSIQPVTFLAGMYAAGARNYFDAVGYHPYSFPNLPSTVAAWSGWSMMNDLPTSIRSVMVANGDTAKPVWITEFGAPTGGPGPTETLSNYGQVGGASNVDDQLQSEIVTQSVDQYEGYSWLGNYFWYSYKDLGTSSSDSENFFGLLNYNGSPKTAYYTYQSLISGKK